VTRDLHFTSGGSGAPVLVMLHGLGAHGGAWAAMTDMAADRWSGRWIAPDLPGHGASPWSGAYSLDDHAAAVAGLLRAEAATGEVVVLGHSMGGAVALAMASGRHGVRPKRVLAFGVKVAWTPEELRWLEALAQSPPKYFDDREAAVGRFLKVSGLMGLIDPASPPAAAGVAEDAQGWRLAADPAIASVGAPPMAPLIAEARCPVRLAAGEHDPMSRIEDLRRWDRDAVALPGLGHNAMVEGPAALWDWLTAEVQAQGS
jgi:pimeloyl-ACP methyl ester carboxylesterase